MKYLFVLLLGILSVTANVQSKKSEKITIKTNIYCDHCKECPTCGKNLQSGLLRIKGVKMYELNEKEMAITVYYNPQKTDASQIRTAISKLGYDADEVRANPVAYENLDGCCKKK